MPTKSETVSQIEGLIGTRLSSLDRMTKKDLEKLYSTLSQPKNLLKMGLRSRKDEIKDITESLDLPELPVGLTDITEVLGDPLKGLSLLLKISKKAGEKSE